MKPATIFAIIAAVLVVIFAVYMIDFDVTEEGEMPDVDVSVEGGKLPEVDADVGTVEVGEEEVTVTVPTVEVTPPEEESNDSN